MIVVDTGISSEKLHRINESNSPNVRLLERILIDYVGIYVRYAKLASGKVKSSIKPFVRDCFVCGNFMQHLRKSGGKD